MSRNRLALSVVLAWHVFAMGLAAIPFPGIDPLPAVALSRHVADDPIAATVAPALDAAVEPLAPVLAVVLNTARPVRRVVSRYVDTLGLGQRWVMFANPPVVDQYVKVRYYVGSSPLPSVTPRIAWTANELVLPAHREDQIRALQSFWDSTRDKALAIALDDFRAKLATYLDREGHLPRELPDDLAPIGRYFGRRFDRGYLKSNEHLLRTEVWYAEVPVPVRGVAVDPAVIEARLAVLRTYYGGPVRGPASSYGTLAYGSSEKEADLKWSLLYFEGR
jgi:hypothetical protein